MLRLSSRHHWLSALALSSALLACSDDEETFTPPGGDAGTAGAAGATAGSSGTSGQSGTAGTAGTAGKGGTAGAAGTAGKAGSAGTTGGAAGSAGTSGTSGQGGAAGATAGTAGAAGTTAGTAGSAGATAGGAGESGAAGTTGGTDAGGAAGASAGAAGTGAGGAGEGGAAGTTGGAGGAAGTAGAGGSGGSAELTCLPATDYTSVLTLEDSSPFCVVRVHKTSLPNLGVGFQTVQVNWGQHGGPLTTDTATGAVVRRWTPGTDVHATLDATATTVTVFGLPSPAFFGPAVDVPALNQTVLSYTSTAAASAGEIIAFNTDLTTIQSRAAVNGLFSVAPLPASLNGLTQPRLLFTALSPVTVAATATNDGAFYALDVCDSTTLIKSGCGSSIKKGTWAGGSSGPVAVASDGTTFAALSTFGGNQEIHGFTPTEATSATATVGTTVLTNTDYSSSIAVSAPTAGAQGLVVVQTSDPVTSAPRAALVYSYSVSNSALTTTAITKGGFLTAKATAPQVVFGASDGSVWVATEGTDAVYFVALKRK